MSRVATPLRVVPLTEAQQALVTGALSLMESIAFQLGQRWANLMSQAELHAAGRAALVEAAQTYDPAQSVCFATYASFRIQGGILDAIRSELRFREPFIAAGAYRAASECLAEQPDPPGYELGDSDSAWRKRSASFSGGVAAAVVASIVADVLSSDNGSEEAMVRRESYGRMVAALQASKLELAQKEQELLDLHYGQELGLREVAERMSVSYAMAKRIHASMLENLGNKLQKRGIRTFDDAGMTG